jgi:hypothetical protein
MSPLSSRLKNMPWSSLRPAEFQQITSQYTTVSRQTCPVIHLYYHEISKNSEFQKLLSSWQSFQNKKDYYLMSSCVKFYILKAKLWNEYKQDGVSGHCILHNKGTSYFYKPLSFITVTEPMKMWRFALLPWMGDTNTECGIWVRKSFGDQPLARHLMEI